MTPHGAPATRFSAVWQRIARSRGSIRSSSAAATADMLAVSTAADELTPLPSGTSEATAIRMPDVSGRPRSRARTSTTPAMYAAQRYGLASNMRRVSS
jgi:hypothetical protein